MSRPPLQFSTIICLNCGAIVALIPPGALIVTMKLRCIHCHVDRTIKPMRKSGVDAASGMVYDYEDTVVGSSPVER